MNKNASSKKQKTKQNMLITLIKDWEIDCEKVINHFCSYFSVSVNTLCIKSTVLYNGKSISNSEILQGTIIIEVYCL